MADQVFRADMILDMSAEEAQAALDNIKMKLDAIGEQEFINMQSTKTLDRITQQVGELENLLSRTASVVITSDDKDVNATIGTLNKLQKELLEVRQIAAKGGVLPVEQLAATEKRLKRIGQEMGGVASKYGVANKSMIRNTLASQNVIRVIQDSPYGPMGMMNNIEQLTESMVRLTQQTGSVTKATGMMLKPLFTGPMAITLLISILGVLIVRWDKVAGAIDKVRVVTGNLTEAQAELNDAVRDFGDLKLADVYDEITVAAGEAALAMASAQEAQEEMLVEAIKARSLPLIGSIRAAFPDLVGMFGTADDQELQSLADRLEVVRDRLGELGAEGAAAFGTIQDELSDALGNTVESFENLERARDKNLEGWRREIDIAKAQADDTEEAQTKILRMEEDYQEAKVKAEAQAFRDRAANIDNFLGSTQEAYVEAREKLTDEEKQALRDYSAYLERQAQFTEGEINVIAAETEAEIADMRESLRKGGDDALKAYLKQLKEHLDRQQDLYRDAIRDAESYFRAMVQNRQRLLQSVSAVAGVRREMQNLRNDLAEGDLNDQLNAINATRDEAIASWEHRMRQVDMWAANYEDAQNRVVSLQNDLAELRVERDEKLAQERNAAAREEIEERYREDIEYTEDAIEKAEERVDEYAAAEAEMTEITANASEARALILERAEQERIRLIEERVREARRKSLGVQGDLYGSKGPLDLGGQLFDVGLDTDAQLATLDEDIDSLQEEMSGLLDKIFDPETSDEEKARLAELYGDNLTLLQNYLRRRRQLREEEGQKELSAILSFTSEAAGYMQDALGNWSGASQQLFETWRSNRERELEATGKTEEEINSIIEKEGKKRFETMKSIMVAEAVVNTLAAGVSAFKSGVESGLPAPFNYILAGTLLAGTLAAGFAQVRKIQSMQIGGNAPSGGSSVGVGSFTQLNNQVAAQRVAHFDAERNSGFRAQQAEARRQANMEQTMRNIRVTYDDRTAADIQNRGINYDNRTNR